MSEYELNKEESNLMEKIAMRGRIQAVLLTIVGLIGLVGAFTMVGKSSSFAIILGLLYSVIFIVMGIVFLRPTDNFLKVARTTGSDMSEIMKGLRELSRGFMILCLLLIPCIVMDILIVIFKP